MGEIAFALDFSPSNIIGTFPQDVWFPNHIGAFNDSLLGGDFTQFFPTVKHKGALSKAIFFGVSLNGNGKYRLPNKTYLDILSPSDLLMEQNKIGRPYNEVIAMGKGGISIYPNMPTSKPISVKEIFFLPKGNVTWNRRNNGDDTPILPSKLMDAYKLVEMYNPGISIKFA